MSNSAQACRPLDIQADTATRSQDWLTGMQAYAHMHWRAFRPGMRRHRALHRHSRGHSVCGALEGYEEAVSHRIDLVTIPPLEDLT